MITNSDKTRIEQAAKSIYAVSETFKKNTLETNRYDLQDMKRKSYIDGAESEYSYWQPIISKKDEQIIKLVEGLENAREQMILGNMGAASVKIEQLLTKHKKP